MLCACRASLAPDAMSPCVHAHSMQTVEIYFSVCIRKHSKIIKHLIYIVWRAGTSVQELGMRPADFLLMEQGSKLQGPHFLPGLAIFAAISSSSPGT